MLKFSDIPSKFLTEAKPFVISLETKTGEKYRGKLFEVGENMNILLKKALCHEKNGKIRKCDFIFIRGNNVKVIILPEILMKVPILNLAGKNL